MGAHCLESKTNYRVVGIVVLILAAGLITAALWLSVGFDTQKYNLYTVYATEAVSGLSDDSIVKYNGVRVGVVDNIELDQFDPQRVRIQLKIDEKTPITMSTHATLINQGITGTTYLGLVATSPSPIPLQKTPGEPYPVIPYKASFLNQLEKNINEVSTSLKRIFDKENAQALKQTLYNIQTVTDVIAKNNKNLNKSLQDLPALIHNLKISVDQFGVMSGHMATAGRQVTTTMQSGKSAINKISQQTLPPIIILLNRLDSIAANLEKVSAQMRQNPAVVIRGTTPPKSGPGE